MDQPSVILSLKYGDATYSVGGNCTEILEEDKVIERGVKERTLVVYRGYDEGHHMLWEIPANEYTQILFAD